MIDTRVSGAPLYVHRNTPETLTHFLDHFDLVFAGLNYLDVHHSDALARVRLVEADENGGPVSATVAARRERALSAPRQLQDAPRPQ